MHNSRKGFTLAEVLVTLAIIGVVAALTIPTLISNTSKQRYTVALKKNIATLNSALQNTSADMAMDAGDDGINNEEELANLFIYGHPGGKQTGRSPNLNIASQEAGVVRLADGTYLEFRTNSTNGALTIGCNDTGEAATEASSFDVLSNCYVIVDVNGNKTPNAVATGGAVKDIYVLGISSSLVSPISLANTAATFVANTGGSETSVTAGNNASAAVMQGSDN